MKHLLYLLTVVLFFAACSKDEDNEKPKWVIDSEAMVNINPDESFNLKALHLGLTPEEIVRDAYSMNFKTHWNAFGNREEKGSTLNRGFPDSYKDYDNNILKFWAIDIINEDGTLLKVFLEGYDYFIMNEVDDTIAYIPNDILRTAETLIKDAYEAEDYDEVYRLFDEAYTYKALE